MFLLGIIGTILLTGCADDGLVEVKNDTDELKCDTDSDCVEASCCHSSSCVHKENAPDCDGVFCTQECKKGTLDCGQGSCKCVEGDCKAVMKKNYTNNDKELPNPAAVHCNEEGHQYEIREDEEGNQYGVCIFSDGSECDAWEYYEGECGKNESD